MSIGLWRFERARAQAAAHAQVRRDADVELDVTAIEDCLRNYLVAEAPDRFRWLDPKRAARLIVEAMRP